MPEQATHTPDLIEAMPDHLVPPKTAQDLGETASQLVEAAPKALGLPEVPTPPVSSEMVQPAPGIEVVRNPRGAVAGNIIPLPDATSHPAITAGALPAQRPGGGLV